MKHRAGPRLSLELLYASAWLAGAALAGAAGWVVLDAPQDHIPPSYYNQDQAPDVGIGR